MMNHSGIDHGKWGFRKDIYRLIEIALQSDIPTHSLYKSALLVIHLILSVQLQYLAI